MFSFFVFFSDKPVVMLEVESRFSDSLSLTWSLLSGEQSNFFLQHYTLQYRTDDGDGWIKRITGISPQATSYKLTNLKPYTEYIVELYATNKHFTSDASRVRARTTEAGEISLGDCIGYHVPGCNVSHGELAWIRHPDNWVLWIALDIKCPWMKYEIHVS